MKTITFILIITLAMTGALMSAESPMQQSQSAELLLGTALHQEEVEGDLEAAIKTYRKVLSEYSDKRPIAARALLQIGQCYERLGKDEARKAYQQLISDYVDQREEVTEARARLAAMDAEARDKGSSLATRQVWAGPEVEVPMGLSPDGRYLTFTDGDTGELVFRDLATGENRRLTNEGSPDGWTLSQVVSPDGKQIAYAWLNNDALCELRIIKLDGSEARIVLRFDERDWVQPLGWSPDGERIFVAFAEDRRDRATYRDEGAFISVADGSAEVITLPWSGASWGSASLSPDGRYVVYDKPAEGSEQKDIFLLSADGNLDSPLIRHPADDRAPVWTPDGKQVLFASDRTGATGFWSVEVTDGKPRGLPKLVKADIGRFKQTVGFTRNGSLYYALNAGVQDVYIAEFDPAAGRIEGEPRPLASRHVGASMGPVWSPDGKYLAYHSQRKSALFGPGSLVIVIRSMETGEEREISNRLIYLDRVHWFPDARSLLAPAYRDGKRDLIDIYRIDVRTGETSLIRGGAGSIPCLSPDGKTVYFVESERKDSKILAYHIETGQEEEIHRLGEGENVSRVFVSPNGRQLAFLDFARTVKVMPAGGGQVRELLKVQPPGWISVGAIAWMPDGLHLLIAKRTGEPGGMTELLRVPVSGGDAQKVGLAMKSINHGDVHPDGRRVAFSSGLPIGQRLELWVMENFLPDSGSGE